jgi:PAS domain S-box-containing protein
MSSDTAFQPIIMLVDDIPANLRLLGDILKERGYKVFQFPKASMAYEAAKLHPPDLFLLDIMMPEINGFELSKLILSTESLSDIPIIFISALTDVESKVSAFQNGGVDYITKPFESKEVLARVETHLALRSTRKQLEIYKNHLEQLVNERTRDLYEAEKVAKIGSWKYNFLTDSVAWSPQIYKIFNWNVNESISVSKILDIVHPDESAILAQQWAEAATSGELSSEHRVWIGHDYIWVRVSAIVEYNESGQPVIAIGTIQNIDKNKKMEIHISKLSKAIEQSPASIVITDIDGEIEYVNPAFCTITGYSEVEVLGKNPRILNSGVQSNEFYKSMWGSLVNGETWVGELANRKKNGELYWERSVISPITNNNGIITNYVAIKEDVTDKKKAQLALIESEERFRTIFEENASIMYVLDAETGNFVDVNPRCIEYYQWNKEEFLSMNIMDINLDQELVQRDLEIIQKNNRHHGVHTHRKRDGEIVHIEVFCGIMKLNNRRMIHVISHDITDQKRYYDTILKQIELLKSIAWTQSHVLRAPLVRLLGLVDLLKMKDYSLFKENELIDNIIESTIQIDSVIREISDKSIEFDNTIDFNI